MNLLIDYCCTTEIHLTFFEEHEFIADTESVTGLLLGQEVVKSHLKIEFLSSLVNGMHILDRIKVVSHE